MTIKEQIDNAPAFAPNQGGRAPPFDFTDAGEFQGKDIAPRSWLVEGWIPKRAVTLLYGNGGVGKSLIALQLGASCAIARPWVGLPVVRTKTLYFSCEDEEDEVARRLDRINALYGVDFADLAGKIAIVDRVGKDNALMDYDSPQTGRSSLKLTKAFESLNRTALDFGAGLVILDALQDVFGGDENNRVETRRFMSALAQIALNLNSGEGGSVVVLAHPSRAGQGSGESGSTAWTAACRSRLHFKRSDTGNDNDVNPDRGKRTLENPKSNYGPDGGRLHLRWRDGAFVPADTDQGGFVGSLDRAAQQQRCEEVFLDLLAKRNAEGRPVSHKTKSGNYAPAEFAKHPARQGFTRRNFQAAMEGLFDQGRIKNVTYGQYKSRQYERIEIVDD